MEYRGLLSNSAMLSASGTDDKAILQQRQGFTSKRFPNARAAMQACDKAVALVSDHIADHLC